MDCLTQGNHNYIDGWNVAGFLKESDMDMSDTLQAGTQRMATNKSHHGGPLGGM